MRRFLVLLVLTACSGETSILPTKSPSDGSPTSPGSPSTTPSTGSSAPFAELAFFQAVKVPVFADGAAIDVAGRNAPLVAGKDAILRAMVDLPPEATGADIELAVDVTTGGVTETFAVTELLEGSSAEDDPESGVVVEVPARAIAEDATYVVRLARDGVPYARFPEQGEAALAPMVTGPLKLVLVPFEVGGFVPDTSPAVVEGYRAALMATYPVTDVEISVAEVQTWDSSLDLGEINVQVGILQEEAMLAGEVGWDVYYYGMATGVASREEFEGITGTSEDGGSNELVRAYFAAGAAFGDQKSEDTLIHEIGHTHRLYHTACDGEDNVDPDYPYAGGGIGVEGYDPRTGNFVSPLDTYDLMSYCFPRWVSDYSYAKLAEHVANAQDYDGYE